MTPKATGAVQKRRGKRAIKALLSSKVGGSGPASKGKEMVRRATRQATSTESSEGLK